MLEVPFTVAFKYTDCPPVTDVEVGLSETDMVGTNSMDAVAVLVVSTTLLAVKMMVCWLVRVIGTV
jgi:hypothetical protein